MKLKNYQKYLNKLLDQSAMWEVTVYSASLKAALGEYVSGKRVINLDENMDESEEIAVLLHELGHFMDDMEYPKLNSEKILLAAYGDIYAKEENVVLSRKARDLVVECERRAWEKGRVVAKKLKIPLGSWYDKEELAGISEYLSIKLKKPIYNKRKRK